MTSLKTFVNNKVLVKVDALETSEVIGDAGNFVKDAKENKNCNNALCRH
jgi:hypothetical protein